MTTGTTNHTVTTVWPFQLERQASELVVTRRKIGWMFVIFGTLFVILWTFGVVGMGKQLLVDPTANHLFGFLAFLAFWLGMTAGILFSLFHRETLRLNHGGFELTRSAIIRYHRVLLPLSEMVGFKEGTETIELEDSKKIVSVVELVQTDNKSITFAKELKPDATAYLVTELNQLLNSLRGRQAAADAAERMEKFVANQREEPSATQPVLLGKTPLTRPQDAVWSREEDFQGLTLANYGRLSFKNLVPTIFMAMFWNGIVGVFVGLLVNQRVHNLDVGMWWFLFLFLIPFEIIGAFLVLAVVFAFLEPFRYSSWRFTGQTVEGLVSYFGIPWRRAYEIGPGASLTLERGYPKLVNSRTKLDTLPLGVVINSSAGKTICAIRDLKEPEARWMADLILRSQPRMFSRNQESQPI